MAEDPTEGARMVMVHLINSGAGEKEELKAQWGKNNVWDTSELSRDFEVQGFMAPYCAVVKKATREKGSVMFQHSPRYYYNFKAA